MIDQKVAKRSACDRCREKRVRCPRAEHSTEPCARCVRAGAACVMGSPGLLGRPRKVVTDSNPRAPCNIAGHSPRNGSVIREAAGYPDLFMSDSNLLSTDSPVMWPMSETPTDILDTPCTAELTDSSGSANTNGQDQSGSWSSDGVANPYGPNLTVQDSSAMPFAGLPDPSGIAPQKSLLDDAGVMDMVNVDPCLNYLFNMHPPSVPKSPKDPCLSHLFNTYPPSIPMSPKQDPSARLLEATISLSRFHEKMACHVSAINNYEWRTPVVIESCIDGMEDPSQNHAAQAILSTKEFAGILRGLNAAVRPPSPSSSISSQSVVPTASSSARSKALNTHTALLVLSTYLQLMQFYDSLFYHLYNFIREIPSSTIEAMKVKAVVRVGGVPAMQDMEGRSYAKVMIEVLQNHVRDMERQMGLPARYCISSSKSTATPPDGVFGSVDLAPLVQVVMAQDDVRSPRTGKSHAESIKESIKGVLSVLDE